MRHDISWPLLLPGLVISLFGWALYWTGIRVVGAMLGAGAGLVISLLLGTYFALTDSTLLLMSVVCVIVGVGLGIVLIKLLQSYFFFFLGALIGAPLGMRLLAMRGVTDQDWAHSPLAKILVPVILSVILGFAVLRGRRYVVAISAALIGSALIAISLPYENSALIAVPCFITSVVVQTGLIRSFLPEDRIDRLVPKRSSKQPAEGK